MVKSPCIKVCKMDMKNNYCLGCGRSINQLTNWTNYTEKEKNEIINNLKKINLLKYKSK